MVDAQVSFLQAQNAYLENEPVTNHSTKSEIVALWLTQTRGDEFPSRVAAQLCTVSTAEERKDQSS
jgi:hypothetical protein